MLSHLVLLIMAQIMGEKQIMCSFGAKIKQKPRPLWTRSSAPSPRPRLPKHGPRKRHSWSSFVKYGCAKPTHQQSASRSSRLHVFRPGLFAKATSTMKESSSFNAFEFSATNVTKTQTNHCFRSSLSLLAATGMYFRYCTLLNGER